MPRVFRMMNGKATSIVTIATFMFAILSATITSETSPELTSHGLIEQQLAGTHVSSPNPNAGDVCCSDSEHDTHSDAANCSSLCHFYAETADVFYPLVTRGEFIAVFEQSNGLQITPFRRPPKTHL